MIAWKEVFDDMIKLVKAFREKKCSKCGKPRSIVLFPEQAQYYSEKEVEQMVCKCKEK